MKVFAFITLLAVVSGCAAHRAPVRGLEQNAYWVRVVVSPLEKRDQYRCDVEVLDPASGEILASPRVATKWGTVAHATVTGRVVDNEVTVTFDPVNDRVVCTASVRDRGRLITVATATTPRG